jgi:hypothetical protein
MTHIIFVFSFFRNLRSFNCGDICETALAVLASKSIIVQHVDVMPRWHGSLPTTALIYRMWISSKVVAYGPRGSLFISVSEPCPRLGAVYVEN